MKYKDYDETIDEGKVASIKCIINDYKQEFEQLEKIMSKIKTLKEKEINTVRPYIDFHKHQNLFTFHIDDFKRFIDSGLDWYAKEIGDLENTDITKRRENE